MGRTRLFKAQTSQLLGRIFRQISAYLFFPTWLFPAAVTELTPAWFLGTRSCSGRCATSRRPRSSWMSSFPNAPCSSGCSQRTRRTRNILLTRFTGAHEAPPFTKNDWSCAGGDESGTLQPRAADSGLSLNFSCSSTWQTRPDESELKQLGFEATICLRLFVALAESHLVS